MRFGILREFLYGKYNIKKQKNGITPQKRGITTQKRGRKTHNDEGDSVNSSLKWLKIGRKWAFLMNFDADSGVFWGKAEFALSPV
jgi:hypothetical protein